MSYCLVIKEVGRKRTSGRRSLSRDCVAYTICEISAQESKLSPPLSLDCALTLVTRNFWCRCVQGKHPYPSRTRRLRPERPMVLHWRRCGRAGGRQIKKRITGNSNECPVEINTGIGKRALSETKRNQKDIENLMLTPISREVLLRNWLLYQ